MQAFLCHAVWIILIALTAKFTVIQKQKYSLFFYGKIGMKIMEFTAGLIIESRFILSLTKYVVPLNSHTIDI